ncbi:hypothetical protein F5X98DRAFT_63867 [Xylaria grammica]|nr:hypothetical protein F5X98DRAFT_63867 [Xylaria grammica]
MDGICLCLDTCLLILLWTSDPCVRSSLELSFIFCSATTPCVTGGQEQCVQDRDEQSTESVVTYPPTEFYNLEGGEKFQLMLRCRDHG